MRRLSLRPGERVGIVVIRRPDPARWDLGRLSKAAAADEEGLAEPSEEELLEAPADEAAEAVDETAPEGGEERPA